MMCVVIRHRAPRHILECLRPCLITLPCRPVDCIVYRAPPPPGTELLVTPPVTVFSIFFSTIQKARPWTIQMVPGATFLENDVQMVSQMMQKLSQSVVPRAMIFQNGQYAICTRGRSPNSDSRTPE